jgi:hypothetical protein
LRSVDVMLSIARTFEYKSNSMGFNEDTFFAFFCERLATLQNKSKNKKSKGCKLANRKAAYSFAVEIPIIPASDINMTLSLSSNYSGVKSFIPFALHNIWAYINPLLTRRLLQLSIK